MFLKSYYSVQENNISIAPEQASRFAKEVAHDFNPLHDFDAKRFCVPGDLLFSLALEKYGLRKHMHFTFVGMVGRDVMLHFSDTDTGHIAVTDATGKTYLHIEQFGELNYRLTLIESFIRQCVAFSGQNFPYVLVPLLAQENVMFNLTRPLVIYESISFSFEHFEFSTVSVELLTPEIHVDGKRATAFLHFHIKSCDKVVGKGHKKLAISVPSDYQADLMHDFVEGYLLRKNNYFSSVSVERES